MATKKISRMIDPISQMPNLGVGGKAYIDFLASTPDLSVVDPLRVMDHEAGNPSSHPHKANSGWPRYFGDSD